MPDNSRVLCFGDLHEPFSHKDALKFLTAVKTEYNPTRVIGTGDEMDGHNMSNWDTELEMMDAKSELVAARKNLVKVAKLFPVVENVESNHTSRLYRAGRKARILKELLVPYKTLLGVEKYDWTWKHHIDINVHGRHIRVVHHAGANVFLNAQRAGLSIIAGHMHTKQKIEYWNAGVKGFAAQVGCLLEQDTPAFNYAVDNIMQPLHGCIVLLDGKPRIIEMNLTKSGKWDRRI